MKLSVGAIRKQKCDDNLCMTTAARVLLTFGLLFVLFGCTPAVKVQPPEKPIEINLNVKIDHEIRVKVDRDIEELISENKELF